MYDHVKDRDFNYLLVALNGNANIKLFLAVFLRIVLFKFVVKYKPGMKKALDIGPEPEPRPDKNKKVGLGSGPRPSRVRVWKDP